MKTAIFVIKGTASEVVAQLKNMTEEEFETRKQQAIRRLRGLR